MTKTHTLVLLGVLLAPSVWGQTGGEAQANDVPQQRERIEAERQQRSMELDAQEAACWSKFAVTDCQNKVKTQRRAMLADLKRQDTRLNDIDRQHRAAEQMQRSREKAAEWAAHQAEVRVRGSGDGDTEEQRQERLKEKLLSHQKQAQTSAAPVAAASKPSSELDATAIGRNREAYADKQRAVEQRRLEREKRLLDKGGSSVPLPRTPP